MITDRTAGKPMPGRMIYIVYPILTAMVTIAGNWLGRELMMQPQLSDLVFHIPYLSLAGLLLIPAFLVHAAARLRKARTTPRLYAAGPRGIATIAALMFLIVLILSDVAKVMLLLILFGGTMGGVGVSDWAGASWTF